MTPAYFAIGFLVTFVVLAVARIRNTYRQIQQEQREHAIAELEADWDDDDVYGFADDPTNYWYAGQRQFAKMMHREYEPSEKESGNISNSPLNTDESPAYHTLDVQQHRCKHDNNVKEAYMPENSGLIADLTELGVRGRQFLASLPGEGAFYESGFEENEFRKIFDILFPLAEGEAPAQEPDEEDEPEDEFYDGPMTGFHDDPAFEKDIPKSFVGIRCLEDLEGESDDDDSHLEDEDEYDSDIDDEDEDEFDDGDEVGFAGYGSSFGN